MIIITAAALTIALLELAITIEVLRIITINNKGSGCSNSDNNYRTR